MVRFQLPPRPFDPDCTDCVRLANFMRTIKQAYPDYFCKPVPAFGDPQPRLLIVGLAPGLHGANRTGRPFTGDYAGELLYETLHEFGYADRPQSVHRADGLRLTGCRITNAVKCVPPANKPESAESYRCNVFLHHELDDLPESAAILALGQLAHTAVLRAYGYSSHAYRFAHGARYPLPNGHCLYASYHCSRYNTQTRRLTREMFRTVFSLIQRDLGHDPSSNPA